MFKFRRRLICLLAGAAIVMGNGLALAADQAAVAAPPRVTLHTDFGDIVLELYPDKAPKTVENFLRYVKDGHYNGTLFHRVANGTLIQGGGFDKKMHEKHMRPPIQNEANNGLSNLPYTIAMARARAPHSATAQFFINTDDNSQLDYPFNDGWGYCVFGKVIGGTDTVDKIGHVETVEKGEFDHLPVKQVVIESASINK
ncbi:MAG TPA: peptidylprolyl isomerase [Burkholderiaceae bacterium]|jgi:peptidyl-prolyl cis-trans isomerase A (cyclophilin A)/peptidyl-prolyl cis-trans isomerase B (cyclophilin B)